MYLPGHLAYLGKFICWQEKILWLMEKTTLCVLFSTNAKVNCEDDKDIKVNSVHVYIVNSVLNINTKYH